MAMMNTDIKYKVSSIKRGFALLIAVIFMSVMLAFGLALGSLAYKQQVLAASAVQSQYAFYAADAGLECALYADQKQFLFEFPSLPPGQIEDVPPMTCDGPAADVESYSWNSNEWAVKQTVSLNAGTRCAAVTVIKPRSPNGNDTFIFSEGYDVPCSVVETPGGARFVARGISVRY